MNRFIYFAIFLTAVFIINFMLNKLRQKTTNELERVLFIRKDPKLYLQLLKNPNLRILYRKSALLQFELNAYLLSGDDQKIENIVGVLDATPMPKGESLEYHQKKLSYYCTLGKKDKAEAALRRIENILSKAKGEKAGFILKESKMIFDIYIRHDTGLIRELEQAQEKEQGAVRGLTLYRLAKLSFFADSRKDARAYLTQAKGLLAGTAWSETVESALEDMAVLNFK